MKHRLVIVYKSEKVLKKSFKGEKMFNIKLLEHTGSDMSIANYARLSFTNTDDIHSVPEGYTEEGALKIVDYCGRNGHSSPFRHPQITIAMELPIFLARQIFKAQVGFTLSERSMRYTKEPELYYPKEWRSAADNVKQGSGGVHPDNEQLVQLYEKTAQNALDSYRELLAEGVAPEMARMVLPQSMLVSCVWTGSLLGFSFVYNQRSDSHAQLEAQMLSKEIRSVIEPLYPVSWLALTKDK